jgi:protein-L-isoaspartate(D-aspartate) O-methyltransferase
VYENVSVAIDPARQLFNGAPGFLARLIDMLALRPGGRVLHVGAGTGYYSAIMAHVVGPSGSVLAVEVDESLAAMARTNLAAMPWVSVERSNGGDVPTAAREPDISAVLVNAGVTHPQEAWLDALAPGGRMILPLTVNLPGMGTLGKGVVVVIGRSADASAFTAEVTSFVAIYSALGLRDESIEASLGQALRRTSFPNLTSLRRDAHEQSEDCWLHAERFCLSMAQTAP